MLNLPTMYVHIGPKPLEPTGLKGMSNACVTNKHPEQSLCLHSDSVTATPPPLAECYTVLADAAVRQERAVTSAEMGVGANPEWFLAGIAKWTA